MRHLSRRDLLLPGADEQRCMPKGVGGWGGAGVGRRRDRAPSFVLISPDVTCEAHFRNYP